MIIADAGVDVEVIIADATAVSARATIAHYAHCARTPKLSKLLPERAGPPTILGLQAAGPQFFEPEDLPAVSTSACDRVVGYCAPIWCAGRSERIGAMLLRYVQALGLCAPT